MDSAGYQCLMYIYGRYVTIIKRDVMELRERLLKQLVGNMGIAEQDGQRYPWI